MRSIVAMAIIFALTGCVSGGVVMTKGQKPVTPNPIESVEILFEKPKKPYDVVALVSSSANTGWFIGTGDTEAAALENLRTQAAEAGADAIVEIQKEIYNAGGSMVSNSYVTGSASGVAAGNTAYATGSATGFGSGFFSQDYDIKFTAKAIKFK